MAINLVKYKIKCMMSILFCTGILGFLLSTFFDNMINIIHKFSVCDRRISCMSSHIVHYYWYLQEYSNFLKKFQKYYLWYFLKLSC